MKQRTWKTALLTMLSSVMLAGIIISVPDSAGGEALCGENDISPLSDLVEVKLD